MSRYYYGTYYGNITKNGYIAIPLPLAAIIRENNYPDKLHVIAVNQTYYPVPVIKLYNVISVSDPDINRTIDDISFMDKTHVVRIPQVESLEYCGIVQLSKKYKVRIPKRAMALAGLSAKDEIAILGMLDHMEICRRDLWMESWEKWKNIGNNDLFNDLLDKFGL